MTRNLPIRQERFIEESLIFPRSGMVYQVRGGGLSGKLMRPFAEAWVALTLAQGEYVHWIDGACRFDPSRIMKHFPKNLSQPEQLLHGLFVGRGFTVHQFTHLIDRLVDEIRITKAKLIVVDGPITMHLDTQVVDYEARSLLRKSMKNLTKIATKHRVSVVVVTALRANSKRHRDLLALVTNRCNATLSGKYKNYMGKRKLWLLHLPSGSSGFQYELSKQETLRQSTSRIIHSRLAYEGAGEIE